MRTYEQTHPWLSFRLDLRKIPAPVWLLLGRASALAQRIGSAPLPHHKAAEIDTSVLAEGVLANAAMDGNTLHLDQVEALLHGQLDLPPSQHYLKVEVENLIKAVRWTEDRVRSGDGAITPWTIQMFNAQVLKGLPWDQDVRPGEWRSPEISSGSGPVVPAEDLPLVMERLCDWLSGPLFDPEPEEERLPMALVQAAMAHLYLIWIAPFGEGNGRTARLVEHQLLLTAGTASRAALLPTMGADRIRSIHGRLPAQCARTNDPIPFLGHWVRALVDEQERLWRRIEEVQRTAAWAAHLDACFDPTSRHAARQRQLLLDLLGAPGPVAPSGIPRLTTALAELYAPLHPKTLQRDIDLLVTKGFAQRTPAGIRAMATAS
jgi:hypothetical protein